jgi:hypothetical protein
MLNKEVCRKCFLSNYAELNITSDVLSVFEEKWGHGYVTCITGSMNTKQKFRSSFLDDDLPSYCSHKLEQGIAGVMTDVE